MFDFVKRLFGLPTAAEKAAAKAASAPAPAASKLDLNKDGKVNVEDVKHAAKTVKKAAVQAKNTAKRAVTKKPATRRSSSK